MQSEHSLGHSIQVLMGAKKYVRTLEPGDLLEWFKTTGIK